MGTLPNSRRQARLKQLMLVEDGWGMGGVRERGRHGAEYDQSEWSDDCPGPPFLSLFELRAALDLALQSSLFLRKEMSNKNRTACEPYYGLASIQRTQSGSCIPPNISNEAPKVVKTLRHGTVILSLKDEVFNSNEITAVVRVIVYAHYKYELIWPRQCLTNEI